MHRSLVPLLAGLGALTAAPVPMHAQGARAGGGGGLTATEISVGGVATLAHPAYWGAGLGIGRRVSGQTRVAFAGSVGDWDTSGGTGSSLAVRFEATGQFLVSPALRTGPGIYGGAGVAWQNDSDMYGTGYLMALLGVEGGPGRPSAWYVELGLGGGVRLAAGWRWRRFPAWWR